MLILPRIILTFIWLFFSFLIGIVVCLLRPFNPNNIQFISFFINRSKYILGYEIEIRNKDRLNQYRPCVFISNHQTNLDIIPGTHTIPERTVTIGKKSLLYIPIFGIFYWLSGNILIDRKNKRSAIGTMDTATNSIVNKNISVWIMPEGTRSKGKGLLPFKKGPFYTAIKAQVPIVPIAISTYTRHLNFNRFKTGKIIIDVLPPIITTSKTIDDVSQLKDQAFSQIKNAIELIDCEIEGKNE